MNGYSDRLLAAVRQLNGTDLPDHAEAFAGILEKAARDLRANRSSEDVANELAPIVRMAQRRI